MKLKTIFWAISCLLILLLLLETVYIFGVLKILGTLLTLTLSYIILTQLIGSIKKTRNSITLIPQKWPKYLFILIALVVAFSLYSTLSNKILSQWEETLGLILIFVFILIPTLIILAKTTNNIDDFIIIDENFITINDGDTIQKIAIQDIVYVTNHKYIEIELQSGSQININKKSLNLNFIDNLRLFKIIQAFTPEKITLKSN
jgi:choline-glycine betaine transporter